MNITQGLRRALQIKPYGVAILEGERKIEWAELGERVSRVASALRKNGVGKGDRVAVLMLNSSRYLELYLAVGWAGAVIVPLNIRWSVPENRHALEDCGAHFLIVDDMFMEAGRTLTIAIPGLALVYAGDHEAPVDIAAYEEWLGASAPIPDAMAGGDELAGIFYTGGTTGQVERRNVEPRQLDVERAFVPGRGLFPARRGVSPRCTNVPPRERRRHVLHAFKRWY
jgi:long-chain acyl-CoA synthetase